MTEQNEVSKARQDRITISVRVTRDIYNQMGRKVDEKSFMTRSEYIRDLINKDLA